MHVDVAKNIQGLAPNTPAIVALGSIKWWQISTNIAIEAMMFALQLFILTKENVCKKIFVQKLVELRSVNYNQIQTGPVAGIIKICIVYGMIEYIDQSLKSRVIVSKSEWKRMVKGCTKEKEGREWIATSIMYKNIDIFKEIEINLENGWGWWKIAKWDCGILWKVKVMFKLIVTNNIKVIVIVKLI